MWRITSCAKNCGNWPRPGGSTNAAHAAAWLGLLGVLSGCGDQSRELIYITNEGSGTVSVIDGAGDSLLYSIPVGTRPRGIRVSPDNNTVYVALSGSPRCPPTMPDSECEQLEVDKTRDGIGVIDARSRKVVRVLPGGSDPESFDLAPGGTLVVSNEDANLASFVSLGTGAILRSVPVGREPEGVRTHPDGKSTWVTGETDHDVTVLDPGTGREMARITVCSRPRDLAFSRDGALGYVTCEAGGAVAVVDARTYRVLRQITMPPGSKPMGIVVDPRGRLLIANGRAGTVAMIDPATDSIVATTSVGTRPWGIGLSRDGTRLYTANGPSNDVAVLDARTLTVIRRIPVGELPWGVAVAREK